MRRFNTYKQQREFLQEQGLRMPMPISSLETVASTVDWKHIEELLLERDVQDQTRATLPSAHADERIERIDERIALYMADARGVIQSIARLDGERAIARTKGREQLLRAKAEVVALCDRLDKGATAEVADFSRALRGVTA